MAPYSRDYSNFFSSNTNYNNPQGMNSNIIWVQGVEGAKALMLNPSAKVIFLDSEIAAASMLMCLIDDVQNELHTAEKYQLNKVAIDYDMVEIINEQKIILHHKYKNMIKN